MKNAILVNLNRCTGCWACATACHVGHDLDIDDWRMHVQTIGSGRGVDDPAGVWPNLSMSWQPVFTKKCTMCPERTGEGQDPFCVYNCPTWALTYGDLDDPESKASKRLEELRGKGFGTFEKESWEDTRKNIVYVFRK